MSTNIYSTFNWLQGYKGNILMLSSGHCITPWNKVSCKKQLFNIHNFLDFEIYCILTVGTFIMLKCSAILDKFKIFILFLWSWIFVKGTPYLLLRIIKWNFHLKKCEIDIHTLVISEVSYMMAAPCSASYDWTQIVCGALVAVLLLLRRCTVFVM